MELPVKTAVVNEIFGPTIQGEGPFIGRPCIFLRLHLCPVQCPGCDTAYTWNGQESVMRRSTADIMNDLIKRGSRNLGLVVTGGEPLLQAMNADLVKALNFLRIQHYKWLSLETSGFVSKTPIAQQAVMNINSYRQFLDVFDSISLSPKITPCLHGVHSDEDLCNNIEYFMRYAQFHPDVASHEVLNFKFVVRDQADIDAVNRCVAIYRIRENGFNVYLMPYGMERDEIITSCENITKWLPQYGYILTPRLHSIIWGKKRGV